MAAVQCHLAQQPSAVVLQRDSRVQFSADVTVQKTAATIKLNHLSWQMRIRMKTNDDILGLSQDLCGYVGKLAYNFRLAYNGSLLGSFDCFRS